MRRRLAALAVAAAALGTLPLAGTATAAPSFDLTRQTPWTVLEGTVEIDLAIIDAPLDATIGVSVHSPVLSRTVFDLTLEGDDLGTSVHDAEIAVGALPAVSSSERRLTLHLQRTEDPRPDEVPITAPGVYPVELTLEAGDAATSSFVTYVVVVDADGTAPAIGEPLGVAWIWPLDIEPELDADGELAPAVVEELDAGGRLGRQVGALVARDLPITVAPGGFLVEQWLSLDIPTGPQLADLLTGGLQVVSDGYVPLDLPSLLAHGLGDEARTGRIRGTASLEESVGGRVDTRTALAMPVDESSFDLLTEANVDRMVVDGDDLAPVASDLTPARPFRLSSADRSVLAAAPDPGLVDLLDGPAAPALRAQQFLAALSLVASEAPNRVRGLVVANPRQWDPDPAFLDAALDGLEGHPLLEPMTLDRFFETVPAETNGGSDLVRELVDPDDGDEAAEPPVAPGEYHEAVRRQGAFRSFAGLLSPRLVPGDRALDVALASTWGSDSPAAARQLRLVETTLDEFLEQIRIPVGSSITLTARTGSIPLTFVNDTGQEVTVHVALESDRLDFPDGASRDVVLPPRASTERFEVETRTPGRFPLVLTVSSPDGEIVVSSARVDVRSTAVSGVGVFLTVGAGLVLAGWWANDLRKRRKRRRMAITTPPGDGGGG